MFLPQSEGPNFIPTQIAGKYIVTNTTYTSVTKINKLKNNSILTAESIKTLLFHRPVKFQA
jgi:hypothetical protein